MRAKQNFRSKQIVEELRKGGKFTPKQLSDRLSIKEHVVDRALKTGVYVGYIKKYDGDKGLYSWIDYQEDERLILEAIKEYVDSHPHLQERNRPIAYTDIDMIVDIAAVKTGKPRKNIEELTLRLTKKFFEERRQSAAQSLP